jgi:hypothetical protein
MSPGKISLSLSLTALAQMAMMSKAEQGRLNAFFANETGPSGPDTKSLDSGAFVSRVGESACCGDVVLIIISRFRPLLMNPMHAAA